MLHTQNYLRSNCLAKLTDEYGIRICEHSTKPLVILNYGITEGNKTHPIIRECRGLVLEKGTWNLVARSFPRFFNWGEVHTEQGDFNWNSFNSFSKEDGSLVILFEYQGEWLINTRGSFGDGLVGYSGKTWQDLFREVVPVEKIAQLNEYWITPPYYTYVFELVGPANKVVREYPQTDAYLIAMFDGEQELPLYTCNAQAQHFGLKQPQTFSFKSIDQIIKFLEQHEDPTFEGVVICDNKFNRWKVKNKKYLSLSRMRGSAGNIYDPANWIEFILSGDTSELLTYFREVTPQVEKAKAKINLEYENLQKVWQEGCHIKSQKEFALYVLPRTKFSSLLFQARKSGEPLDKLWQQSGDRILKVLFKVN